MKLTRLLFSSLFYLSQAGTVVKVYGGGTDGKDRFNVNETVMEVEDMARAEGGGWFVGALHALLLILALAAMVALWWRHLSHMDPFLETAAPSAWDALHPQGEPRLDLRP